MSDRLFDPRALPRDDVPQLFDSSEVAQLFAIADQATNEDRRAMRTLGDPAA